MLSKSNVSFYLLFMKLAKSLKFVWNQWIIRVLFLFHINKIYIFVLTRIAFINDLSYFRKSHWNRNVDNNNRTCYQNITLFVLTLITILVWVFLKIFTSSWLKQFYYECISAFYKIWSTLNSKICKPITILKLNDKIHNLISWFKIFIEISKIESQVLLMI